MEKLYIHMVHSMYKMFEGSLKKLKLQWLQNERGISLLESVASLIIISIVLLSFVQLFIQTNKSAVNNNERLVLLNLANAELGRLKLEGATFSESVDKIQFDSAFNQYKVTVQNNDCDEVKDSTNPTPLECEKLQLYNVTVMVESPKTNSKAVVEGLVPYAK